jgi:zinc transport system permease protein
MLQSITSLLEYAFMRNALAAGVLVSIACGVIGTYVVIKRIVFISGGIAHTAYGGIGLGYFFNFNPVIGAILFSLAAAFGMGIVHRRTRQRSDTIIGVMWALGMAIGIILIDRSPGYKTDLMSYLFGSILAVPQTDLIIMAVLNLVIIVLVILFYKELLAVAFDETFATVQNVPVDALEILLLSMIGLTIVMMMRVVGLIMVIALLTIPAAISGLFIRSIKKMMAVSSILGIVFTIVGLLISYFFNLTSGATIILVAGVSYFLALAFHQRKPPAEPLANNNKPCS